MAPNGKPYYRVTDAPDTKVDALALREIGKQLLQEDSPYILGKVFTAVEVALAPFWQRIHYYRPQLVSQQLGTTRMLFQVFLMIAMIP